MRSAKEVFYPSKLCGSCKSKLQLKEREEHNSRSVIWNEVSDLTHLHARHAGYNPLGETHFSIHIVSPAFAGMSSVARHREIYRVLSDEMRERVHLLCLVALAIDEQTKK